MTISVILTESTADISKKINVLLSKELNKKIKINRGRAGREFKNIIRGWLDQSIEVQSLLSQGTPASLNSLFGLPPGSANSAIESIINAIADSIEIKVTNISVNLTGELVFNFQEKTFANLLALPQGHQITELGADLHWLDWLLTKGDTTVVKGFFYDPSNKGRSGGGTMKIGGAFRVPPEFSGSVENNFITRAFQGKDREITNVLNKILV